MRRTLTPDERGRLLDLDVVEEARRLRDAGMAAEEAFFIALDNMPPARSGAASAPPSSLSAARSGARPSDRVVNFDPAPYLPRPWWRRALAWAMGR